MRTGLASVRLPAGNNRESRNWISAVPGQFVAETRLLVEHLSVHLRTERATRFELAFHNIRDNANWGDHILAAIRYE